MLFVLAIGLGAGIVAYALSRVPTGIGVLHAAAGLVVYALIGYLWTLALFFAPAVVEPMVAPLRGVHLDGALLRAAARGGAGHGPRARPG